MPSRRPLVGGNWKMNTTRTEAEMLAKAVIEGLGKELPEACDICLFPPFPWLSAVTDRVGSASVAVGGQDVSDHPDGAFTGQTSAAMLLDAGCRMALVGHSERRHGLGESDLVLNDKLKQAISSGLEAMLCVGETLAEREAGQSEEVVAKQVKQGLSGVPATDLGQISIAYEPVWAIGTGRTAAAEDAQAMHCRIRADLENQYDAPSAKGVRIVYGGSVKPSNADAIFAQPDVDGGLIGGASLDAEGFIEIIRAAASMSAS
ncbi:MAG: triose-phosphate isomerase [Phycisphaerales bacterium]|nr:triose-phosphate isomerase [Phycisphaerales bacterium]